MKWEKIAALALAAALCLPLAGCGGEKPQAGTTAPVAGSNGEEADWGNPSPDEDWEFPADDLSYLDGSFVYTPDKDTLRFVPQGMLDGAATDQDLWAAYRWEPDSSAVFVVSPFTPTEVDRQKGEEVWLIGSESNACLYWEDNGTMSYQVRGTEGAAIFVDVTPLAVVGYTAFLPMDKIYTIDGVDIASVGDPRQREVLLANLDLAYVYEEYGSTEMVITDEYDRLLTYAILDGTQCFESQSYMNSWVFARTGPDLEVPVKRTADGYFLLDVSALPDGYYCYGPWSEDVEFLHIR